MRSVSYARTSTNDGSQDLEVQLAPIREFVKNRGWKSVGEFVDQESGLSSKRASFQTVMKLARQRKIDIIVVSSLDRWSRSLKELISSLDELPGLGVAFVSLRESLDFSTPTGQLMTHLLGAFAQFEVQLIRQRVVAGLVNAKNRGIKLGRPSIKVDVERVRELGGKGYSIRKIAKETGLSPTTVFKTLRKPTLENPVKSRVR